MKINKISSNLIKPHTPTPPNLKNYKISFVDEYQLPINFAIILFYESKPEAYNLQLEESLSKVLVDFYPLAGRFTNGVDLIDCGDQGADLVDAEAPDAELADVVASPDVDRLNALLPPHHFRLDEAAGNPLLSIQATRFRCGGLAVAVSVSHRVFDAASLATFAAAWSNAASKDGERISPSFHLPSLLPSRSLEELGAVFGGSPPKTAPIGPVEFNEFNRFVLRRLIFDKPALTRLRNGASAVRAACAVLGGALVRADCAVHGAARGSVLFQPVDMRERTAPPQPRHACGNFIFPAATPRIGAAEADRARLVGLLGDAVRRTIARHVGVACPDGDGDGRDVIAGTLRSFIEQASRPDTNLVTVSDWSRFGFYEADFGWGRPVWAAVGPQQPLGNIVVLMGCKQGDGIEAWVQLNRAEMSCFEQDEDVKGFIC